MTAEEFVKAITELKPKESELNGISDPFGLIKHGLKEFDIKKKFNEIYDDPISSIVNNYDVTSLRIRGFAFDNDYFDDGELFCFGWDEIGDRIAIHKITKKIVAYDVYGDRITFVCAENSSKFLEALIEVMRVSRDRMLISYSEVQADKRCRDAAYVAALKAGGEEFEDYYKGLLWVD